MPVSVFASASPQPAGPQNQTLAPGLRRDWISAGVERALFVGQAAVQADAGLLAEGFEVFRVGRGLRGAVEKVGFAGCRWPSDAVVQAGKEGRDADAAGHPDLRCRALVAVDRPGRAKIKIAVGAFEGDALPDVQGLRELTGEVAERLDGEGEGAGLALPGGGDGEGVGAFGGGAEVGQEELAGAVAGPVVVRATGDFEDAVGVPVQGFDLRRVLALFADASAQREQGGDDAGDGKQGSQPAERLLPEVAGQHHQAVEDASEEDGAEGFVHEAEPAVGNAFDEGDDDQREQDVAGPFADVLGEFHPEIRRAFGAGAARTGGDKAGARQVFRQPFAHPVRENENAATDAERFVQLVELVQPADALFQPARAGGEDDAGAHPPQGEDAGEDDDGAPPVPETGVAGEQVGEDEEAPQAERQKGEGGQGALHGKCVLLFLNARILRREM